jgi:hypothetical protein
VEPIVKEATDAVNKLTNGDIAEAKATQKPSEGARVVFVCVYMLIEKATNPAKIEWA